MDLNDAEVARYARQLILPGFDSDALGILRSARVHVIGAGPAAAPALLFLAAGGIGTLYVDDGDEVAPEDAAAWIYRPADVGRPRLFAAIEAVQRVSGFVKLRAHATGTSIDAVLVCADSPGIARTAAEHARKQGVPHVVALAEGDGGAIVTVPRGEPCFSCATRPGSSLKATPGAASAVATLGALELLLVVTGNVRGPGSGRRIDLVAGRPSTSPTARNPRCDCATVY